MSEQRKPLHRSCVVRFVVRADGREPQPGPVCDHCELELDAVLTEVAVFQAELRLRPGLVSARRVEPRSSRARARRS